MILPKNNRLSPAEVDQLTAIVTEFGCRIQPIIGDLRTIYAIVGDERHELMINRLEGLGSRLALVLRCRHEKSEYESKLREALAAGCDLILIAGATVTKDRLDTVPAAVVAVGGAIDHFGMPVEPGNMLLLAHVGEAPVLVLPGCARSRRSNGRSRSVRRRRWSPHWAPTRRTPSTSP